MIRIVPMTSHRSRFQPLWRRRKRPSLLERLSHGILPAADSILDLAFGLVRFAFIPQMVVARHRADRFLYRALGLFRRAVDSVFIHNDLLLVLTRDGTLDAASRTLADRASVGQARKIPTSHNERSGG